MAICYNEQNRVFTLQTAHSTYQMQADRHGYLLHLYYGPSIFGEAVHLLQYVDRGFSGNPAAAGTDRTYSLDFLPQEYPFLGSADFRDYAFAMRNADGTNGCDLRYASYEIIGGKYGLDGLPTAMAGEENADVETLKIVLSDAASAVEVHLFYGVFAAEDVITRAVRVVNKGETPVELTKVSTAALDMLFGDYKTLTFYGRHAMERNLAVTPIGHGRFSIGSRRGASSHHYNPFVVFAEMDATEDAGSCYGMHFVYSGNFRFTAEKDGCDNTRVVFGLPEDGFCWKLAPGESFDAPEVLLTFSEAGYGLLSNRIHRFFGSHITRGPWQKKTRPVLINNWEATYFDFDGDKLDAIAAEAQALGIDMLVLDDGWFGKRDDDNSGLGDWKVNTRKLKGTMGEIAKRIHDRGLRFGLWFEPEMISEDSDLYREHPDWAFVIPGRKPSHARNQLVLNFSRPEVVERIFADMCTILDHAEIDYIKWDMNRHLTDLYSASLPADRQGEIFHRYVLGVYRLAQKLLERYPELLLEGCTGGGGRFDAGMLCYAPQIWCSDNTDAIDRCRIQYGTSFGYPLATMGSHVSAVPNHQTGRVTPFKTRGIVAMAGTFGYELDPGKLSEEEKTQIKEQLKVFRADYDTVHFGDYYRLENPFNDRELSAWMCVSKDQKHAVVSAVALSCHGNNLFRYTKLKGLDPQGLYRIEERHVELFGSTLMQAGLALEELKGEYSACELHLTKL